jgi:hypothetical protein
MSGHRPFVDIDRLERVLLDAARSGRTVTYGQVLRYFDKGVGRGTVALLCRDLGLVCARNRARGEPELAVLVVRKTDGLPGDGFMASEAAAGRWRGPLGGPEAAAHMRRLQAEVLAHFARGEGARDHDHGPAPRRRLPRRRARA